MHNTEDIRLQEAEDGTIKYGESLAGELAVDSSSVNGGNFVGNLTHCRTRLRHTAEGGNN